MSTRTWTNEQLIEAVKNCNTFAGVSRKLGLSNYGANSRTIKKYIVALNLSTEHFLTRAEQLKIARGQMTKLSLDEIFSVGQIDRKYIKKIIIKNNLIPYDCSNCHTNEWCGQKLSLHLDHINGNNIDNRLSNLRFLCPNCHSLTDTYCANNMKSKEPRHCLDCGKDICKDAKRCVACNSLQRKTKIDWPPIEELVELVKELGYRGTGRKLGVTDNAVKIRIKKHSK